MRLNHSVKWKRFSSWATNLQLSLSFTELPAPLKYLLLNCMSSQINNISFSLLLFKVTPWFHYLRWLNSPKSLLRKVCHWKSLPFWICCIQKVRTIIFWAMFYRIWLSFFFQPNSFSYSSYTCQKGSIDGKAFSNTQYPETWSSPIAS